MYDVGSCRSVKVYSNKMWYLWLIYIILSPFLSLMSSLPLWSLLLLIVSLCFLLFLSLFQCYIRSSFLFSYILLIISLVSCLLSIIFFPPLFQLLPLSSLFSFLLFLALFSNKSNIDLHLSRMSEANSLITSNVQNRIAAGYPTGQ